MSVTTLHPQYLEWQSTWVTLRDAYAGSGNVKSSTSLVPSTHGVKQAGTRYLPQPSGMRRPEQYAAYRDRASWRGATEVMVHGTTGAIFRREPQIEVPPAMEADLQNITRSGVPLRTFVETVVREVLLMGRFGVLIEYPRPTRFPDGTVQPPPPGSRPYWVPYITEEITNWHTVEFEGSEHLDMIVLKEAVPIRQGPWPTDDYFVIKAQERRRVLRLNEVGVYEESLWLEVPTALSPTGQKTFTPVETWIPTRQGQPLLQIPFLPFSPLSLTLEVQKSLMEPLVEVNFRHYRHSADYEHGLHLTSLPTPWISGDLDPMTELLIGSLTAWILPTGANVGMLEYQGQGLQPHEHAMEADISEMATFGTRILEGTPLVAETATAVMNRTQGTESPIQTLIRTVSEGMTQALRWHAWWAGLTERLDDPGIDYVLNNDLVSRTMEPAMLKVLMEQLLNNTISYETYYWNLQRGEVARPMVAVDEEQALIEVAQAQMPLALPSGPMARNGQTVNGQTR